MKLLVLIGLIGGAFLAMHLIGRANSIRAVRREDAIRKRPNSEEMIACRTCGAFHVKGSPCDCNGTPTP